jgi:ADP-heptose:LPS heptosyltransferase
VEYFGGDIEDFADTAALISQLDLVVSVDTSVTHLAGALAKPVWILLPFAPDFRWMLNRTDSPWYPSARLLRQPKPGDWAPVLESLREALREWLTTRA